MPACTRPGCRKVAHRTVAAVPCILCEARVGEWCNTEGEEGHHWLHVVRVVDGRRARSVRRSPTMAEPKKRGGARPNSGGARSGAGRPKGSTSGPRAPESEILSFRVPVELAVAIDDWAAEDGRKRGDVARDALAQAVERRRKK